MPLCLMPPLEYIGEAQPLDLDPVLKIHLQREEYKANQ